MNLSRNFAQVLTGCDMEARTAIKDAITKRAAALIPTFTQRKSDPRQSLGYCYDGNRTRPENLGWRLLQAVELSHLEQPGAGCMGSPALKNKKVPTPTVEAIEAGQFDEVIEITWHEAASAEYWYRYEKQW